VVTLLFAVALFAAHPIHTTVLHLQWNARSAILEGTLRIFEDDLRAAAADARLSASAYVLRSVGLTAAGRVVPLEVCGERRTGDAVLVCLRGSMEAARDVRVRNDLLLERYEDQVNIVRILGDRPVTVLMTHGTREVDISPAR
jgi:hypothetical protein